jgi:hypothetical protein
VTRLRKMMLEELQRRNHSAITTRNYLRVVTEFAKYFGKSPDKLGPNEVRTYQAYLLTSIEEPAVSSVPAVQRVQRAALDVRVEDFDGTAIGRDVSTGIVHRIGIVVRRTCGMYLPDDVFDREGQEHEALGPSQPSFVSSVQVRAGIPFHCL